jgi:diguanylate cyclase (GGDEF)-like protein
MSDGPKTEVIERARRRTGDPDALIGTLAVLEGPNVGGFYVLEQDVPLSIGRAEDCGASFPHSSVSRLHAEVTVQQDLGRLRARLEDRGSTNGVCVNHRFAEEHWLASGDKIRMGRILLRFEWMNGEEVAYHERLANEHQVAIRDVLTGLLTRSFLDDRLPKLMEEADASGRPICAILFDLDHFKGINDQHGHLVGDEVLRTSARAVQQTLRRGDFAIRYGGEELLCILPDAALDAAAGVAERIRTAVTRDGAGAVVAAVKVTASLGVAERNAGESVEQWIARADAALFDAKRSGRDRVVEASQEAAPGHVAAAVGADPPQPKKDATRDTAREAPVAASAELDRAGD